MQEEEFLDLFDPPLRYRFTQKIGHGSFGRIFRAEPEISSDQRIHAFSEVAVKVLPDWNGGRECSKEFVDKSEKLRSSFKRLELLDHPNLVKMHWFTKLQRSSLLPERIAIAMEYCAGENLARSIRSPGLSWRLVIDITRQTASGLAHLHSNGIVHADISPNNILLTKSNCNDYVVKIVDLDGSVASPYVSAFGTPKYMSPEMKESMYDSRVRITRTTDIWSLGRVLQEMAFSTLDSADSRKATICATEDCESRWCDKDTLVIHGRAHDWWNVFISKCLMYNPKMRASADDLLCSELLAKDLALDSNTAGSVALDLWSCHRCSTTTKRSSRGEDRERLVTSVTVEQGPLVSYHLESLIGAGTYGPMYRGRLRPKPTTVQPASQANEKEVVIKELPLYALKQARADNQEKRVAHLIRLTSLKHGNVVSVLECGFVKETPLEYAKYSLVMEYCPGTTVDLEIKKGLCSTLTREYSHQILEGLHYLHDQKVVNICASSTDVLLTNIHSTGAYQTAKIGSIEHSIRQDKTQEDQTAQLPDRSEGSFNLTTEAITTRTGSRMYSRRKRNDVLAFGLVLHQMVYGCSKTDLPSFRHGSRTLSTGTQHLSGENALQQKESRWSKSSDRLRSRRCWKDKMEVSAHQTVFDADLRHVLKACFQVKREKRVAISQLLTLPFFTGDSGFAKLLTCSALPEFTAAEKPPYHFEHNHEEGELGLWHGLNGGSEYMAFDKDDEVKFDETLDQFVTSDLPLALKLLHEKYPIGLRIYSDDGTFPGPFRFAGLADVITSLRVCFISQYPDEILPNLFLPNLTVLELLGCGNVRIQENSVAGYPKLRYLGLTHCLVHELKESVFSSLPSLERFYFHPALSCDRHERGQEPNEEPSKYSWLEQYLTAAPDVASQNHVRIATINGRTLMFDEIPALDPTAVRHTLECSTCSQSAYDMRLGDTLFTTAGFFGIKHVVDNLHYVQNHLRQKESTTTDLGTLGRAATSLRSSQCD